MQIDITFPLVPTFYAFEAYLPRNLYQVWYVKRCTESRIRSADKMVETAVLKWRRCKVLKLIAVCLHFMHGNALWHNDSSLYMYF